MTVQELIDRLRTYLNDPQVIEFTDAELIGYISDVLKELSLYFAQLRYQPFLKRHTAVVAAGTQSVSLPSDFLKEEYVLWDKKPLEEIHPDYRTDSGTPRYYFREGNSFYLYPIPNKDGAVKMAYYPLLTVSTTTDTLPTPAYFESVLLHSVTVKAKNRIELNPQTDAQLRAYIYRQVKDFMKMSRSWNNVMRMRAR